MICWLVNNKTEFLIGMLLIGKATRELAAWLKVWNIFQLTDINVIPAQGHQSEEQ